MNKDKGCLGKLIIGTAVCFVLSAGAVYASTYLKNDLLTICAVLFSGFVSLGVFAVLIVRANRYNTISLLFEHMRNETRPVLSYLGRELTKAEMDSPHSKTVVNNAGMSETMGSNLKMTLDANSNMIVPYEETQTINMDLEDTSPIISIRPFYLANYGKSIAVGLYVSLNGEKISFRSESVLEPNAKIKLEIKDTIRFNKNLKEFTLSYADVYGQEYVLRLNGIIEFGQEQSEKLGREVYFFYVEGFDEVEN